MHLQTLGAFLLIAGTAVTPVYAGSIEAFSSVIAGLNQCAGGGAPAGMYAFFGNIGYGIGSTAGASNGISDCGLSGGINDVFQPVGPVMSQSNLNYTGGFGGLGSTYTGTAAAFSNYGQVSTTISGSLSGPDRANGIAESAAYGIVPDSWNIGVPPGTAATGYAALTLGFDGEESLTSPVSGELATEIEVQIGSGTPETIFSAAVGTGFAFAHDHNTANVAGCVLTINSYNCPGVTLTTGLLPVTFGTVEAFNLGMLLTAEPGAGVSTDPNLTLTGIAFYDANGNPLSDFTITSGSGAVYGPDGIESAPGGAPEPATFLLAAGALLGIGWRRSGKASKAEWNPAGD